jgi:SAM-dependent methyltransferase
MDIANILTLSRQPRLYEKGTAVMWTDEYISRQLLAIHLDPASNAASRNPGTIERLVGWLQEEIGPDCRTILDLGCGPGLYAERLARIGYDVTGVDFSANSIAYARAQAKKLGLNIDYSCLNYLDMDYREQFDAVLMIYCDFGVLTADERALLIKKICAALKPGGVFIFDALNKDVLARLRFEKTWTASEKGFWRDGPYVCLAESFHYPEQKAVLDQYIVIDANNQQTVYRFWNHYFAPDDIGEMFGEAGFSGVKRFDSLLNANELYNDTDVTFYEAKK